MRHLLGFLRLSPPVRSRLRWLAIGGVLAALVGQLAWRVLDGRLGAEATRQARAGHSLAVVATREDWAAHVLPVAITEPGEAGASARAVASAKINLAVSLASRGDVTPLQRLAAQAPAEIRSLNASPTHAGGRWGEWALRRLAGAVDRLPAEQRIALLVEVDDALVMLSAMPRLAPEPVQRTVAAAASPLSQPQAAEPTATEVLAGSELVVLPTPTFDAPSMGTSEPSSQPEPALPKVATQWVRPQRDHSPAPFAPVEPAVPAPAAELVVATAAPQALGDRHLLSEALRLESLLSMSSDGEPRAMGPSRAPAPRDDEAAEAPTRERLDAVRVELVARGYSGVTRRQVEGVLSTDPRTRVALVEGLLTDRSGDPARVLLLMASDESPAVRAAAISALGGSSNREHVAKALELATQDQDLSVGRLADAIRERLR